MPRDFTSFTALAQTMRNDVRTAIAHSEKIMLGAGNIVKEHAQAQLGHYLNHGGPYPGEPWAPLAASTIARKGHDTPLVDTGTLHDSIEVTASHKETEIGVKGGQIGSDGKDIGDIAVWMEFGTISSGGSAPPRPFMGPALHEEQDEIVEFIAAGIFVELSRRA